MSVVSSSSPEVLTSGERWRRWEQRGFDSDARFARRVRWLLWAVIAVLAALAVAALAG